MNAEQIAGTNLDDLAASADALKNPPPDASSAAPEPKRGRGRPKGSATKRPGVAPSPAMQPAAPPDPAELQRLEKSRQRAAETRAALPSKIAEKVFVLTKGYTGDAFKLAPGERAELAAEYRNAQRAIATMPDGFVKGLLEIGVGSDDKEDGPVMALITLAAAQADILTTSIKRAESEIAKAPKL